MKQVRASKNMLSRYYASFRVPNRREKLRRKGLELFPYDLICIDKADVFGYFAGILTSRECWVTKMRLHTAKFPNSASVNSRR